MSGEEERHWLDSARAGDVAALRSLLERYGPQIAAEMRNSIGRQWQTLLDADDVMQVTYLEAFLQVRRLTARDGGGFAAWLRQIAENNLRDAIKELGRKKRPHPARRVTSAGTDESYVALIELVGATSATPSRQAARDEAGSIVEQALGDLPPDYRTVIRLYDLEGREIQDVAAAMGRSTGAVHMLRARAHDRLRDLLGSATNYFSDAS